MAGILEMSTEMSSGRTAPVADGLSDAQYHERAYAVIAAVESQADRWLQDEGVDVDASRTGGLLELTFANRSKIVINTQPPLHEIWLAARGGGFHFRFRDGKWVDTKSSQEFFALLSVCASDQAGCVLQAAPV
jgi:CyaY protein